MALYLDDKKVSIAELLKTLKISESEVPYTKRLKEFEMVMDRDIHGNPKRDQDGNYQTRRKIAGTPQYSVFVPSLGFEVRIRIANTQRKEKEEYKYTPSLITMDPAEDGSFVIVDQLEFVFWFLHPWCRQSPFHQLGSPTFFEYKDQDARSKSENDHQENLINALGYIVGQHAKGISQLRSIAKGLNIAGVDDMTDEFVKKSLRLLAQKDPIGFVNKIDSRETVFSGLVQDAVDKKILTTQNINGMIRWYMNGKEILPVPFSMDPMNALRDELSSKWHLYSKEIQDSINGLTVASNLDRPEFDEAFSQSQAHKVETKSELTPEQKELLKQMSEDAEFDAKIKKLADLDINTPGIHHATVASYNKHIDAINAYKASLVSDLVQA